MAKPAVRSRAISASTRPMASRMGFTSINCEPIWQLTPSAVRFGKWRVRVVDGFGLRDIDAELVLAQSGRNIRVGRGIHVGIHAHGKGRLHAAPRRQRIDQGQLRLRLAIEHADAALERVIHFGGGLPHARKHHPGWLAARAHDTIQFAAGNDVETGACFGQQRENAERRVSLHCVTNGVRQVVQGFIVSAIIFQNGGARIYVRGRAGCARNVRQGNVFAIEILIGVVEHARLLWGRTAVLRGSSRTRSEPRTDRRGRRSQDWSPAPQRCVAATQTMLQRG